MRRQEVQCVTTVPCRWLRHPRRPHKAATTISHPITQTELTNIQWSRNNIQWVASNIEWAATNIQWTTATNIQCTEINTQCTASNTQCAMTANRANFDRKVSKASDRKIHFNIDYDNALIPPKIRPFCSAFLLVFESFRKNFTLIFKAVSRCTDALIYRFTNCYGVQ